MYVAPALRSLLVAGCLSASLSQTIEAADSGLVGNTGVDPGIFATPLTGENLQVDLCAQWLAGKTTPAQITDNRPSSLLWTRSSATNWMTQAFAKDKVLGVRHLRVGFSQPVTIGSLFVVSNCRVSVLKDTVQGPGDPGDESQWISAERLMDRQVTTAQPEAGSLILWALPSVCTTRALRLTHEPQATASDYACLISGIYLLADRYANIAPQGRITVSTNDRKAERLLNTQHDNWQNWDNGEKGSEQVVSTENPAWVSLSLPGPATVRGIGVFGNGASAMDISTLPATAAGKIAVADDTNWKVIRETNALHDWYPSAMTFEPIDIGEQSPAGAWRLRLTKAFDGSKLHPHHTDGPKSGHRVWLDELIAMMPLGDRPLSSAILPPWPTEDVHPPIAIPFHLDEPRHVTLVIEDQAGNRVRNLISDAPYPAGDQVAWWDGLDDLGRDSDAAGHGLYHVPGALVKPGTYRVRGLTVPEIELHYELSPDDAGEPPWPTEDGTGGWGTNHTPPSCAAWVPADRTRLGVDLTFIGSYISEGGSGLFWVDPEGKKRGGVGWLGGHWTGAQTLAFDGGDQADKNTAVFVTSGFDGDVRFTSLNRDLNENKIVTFTLKNAPVAKPANQAPDDHIVEIPADLDPKMVHNVQDLAARDGLLAAALPQLGEVWIVDSNAKRLLTRLTISEPTGVAFDTDGALLITSGKDLLRLDPPTRPASVHTGPTSSLKPSVPKTQRLFSGLDHPAELALMADGNVVVSEWGVRHQVRIYRRNGSVVRSIGKPGAPQAGKYDKLHLNKPAGVAIEPSGRMWITEAHYQPKRVGLWSAKGSLEKAWYGPSRYGGGGTLDAFDKTLFYNCGMAFRIDWKAGTLAVERILLRDQADTHAQFPPEGAYGAGGMPEQPHRVDGRQFFSNWTNSHPTNGASIAVVWEDRKGVLQPISAMGRPWDWPVLEAPEFTSRWPEGVDAKQRDRRPNLWFAWSDRNLDGIMQPEEMEIHPGQSAGITVQSDLSFVTRIDNRIVRFAANVGKGPLTYDFANPQILQTGAQGSASSGGDVYLLTSDKQLFSYPPPLPFSNYSVGGGMTGTKSWSYPNMWPGLHASHEATVPDQPGMLIGPTRLLGEDVTPRGGEAGTLVFLNQNMGNMVVFTSDGLMAGTLFYDARLAPRWRMPARQRNMRVDGLSLGDETFWPTVTQIKADGTIYLCTGAASVSSLVRVDGFERAKRIPARELVVDTKMIEQCVAWQTEQELERRRLLAPARIAVPTTMPAPQVDGDLADWANADWASIDERGTAANFNSNSKPYAVSATLRIAGDRLYAAWRSNEKDLLANTAEQATAPFKTGGALDLMLATDPSANPDRPQPVAGDLRLLITRKNGANGAPAQTWAVLYRAVVAGTADNAKAPFSSPWRTITFDQVLDVSSEVALAQKEGDYEVSIPLSTLGLKAQSGMNLRGDLGVLRGSAGLTTQRVYWSNKATGITADVPSEAQLLPNLWGTFELK